MMPPHHALFLSSPIQPLSPCPGLSPFSTDHAGHSPEPRGQRQVRELAVLWRAQTRHATPERARQASRHARARRRPANSVDPLLPPRASRLPTTSATTWTCPLARARPVAVAMANAIRHGHEDARTMTSSTDHHFQRADARRDRQDVAYSTASSPGPLRHCITVVDHDLPRTPRPCLDSINRALLSLLQTH
jgi:hypothetical protein